MIKTKNKKEVKLSHKFQLSKMKKILIPMTILTAGVVGYFSHDLFTGDNDGHIHFSQKDAMFLCHNNSGMTIKNFHVCDTKDGSGICFDMINNTDETKFVDYEYHYAQGDSSSGGSLEFSYTNNVFEADGAIVYPHDKKEIFIRFHAKPRNTVAFKYNVCIGNVYNKEAIRDDFLWHFEDKDKSDIDIFKRGYPEFFKETGL